MEIAHETPGALALFPLLAAGGGPAYRFSRPLQADPGWNELTLPFDVFDAARPDLGDVRIVTAQGEEIPYALDQQVAPAATRLPLLDVQSVNGKETSALVDRGAHPPLIDRIKLEISDVEFIKPVLIEASPDRTTWGEIAHQSIFATPGGGGTAAISFAPNDRRYLRFRFDDRNGPPIHPIAVDVAPSQPKKEPQLVALAYQPQSDSEMAVSTLAVTLPAAHLPISELRLDASEPVFSRRVRVYERVWFRDEVSRRLVGDAVIERTVLGGGTTSVPVSEAASRVLELDVERSAGAALHVTGITAALPGRSLVFLAPGGGPLELRYGAAQANPPAYDLPVVLRHGWPSPRATAALGAPIDKGGAGVTAPAVVRGAVLDKSAWRKQQQVTLPAQVPTHTSIWFGRRAAVRCASDRRTRRTGPVPDRVDPRHMRVAVEWRAEHVRQTTTLTVSGLAPHDAMRCPGARNPSSGIFFS